MAEFIVKIASRCNLNCSYCYIYNKMDTAWKKRPATMSTELFDLTLGRIRRHLVNTDDHRVFVVFHGGEPTLVGPERFAHLCRQAYARLSDVATVTLGVQTNGTRFSEAWIEVFRRHDVQVTVSMDGPKAVHDAQRVDRRGRGSHDQIAEGLARLTAAGVGFGILCVVPLGADPVSVHRHFLDLGCREVGYLLPAETYETIDAVRDRYGPTPCADFLIPVFDDWWFNGTLDVRVREFWTMGRLVLGGRSDLDSLGNPPLEFLLVETDGAISGLDLLRVCEDGLVETGLHVATHDFAEVADLSPLHGAIARGMPLPQGCRACPEASTCAGGYLPHRYSRTTGFDNRSVWCADLLKVFAHVRTRMDVPHTDAGATVAAPAFT